MSEENELPRGWVWTTIGDIAETTSGRTPSRNHPEYYSGTIPWVKSGELEDAIINNVEEFITEEGLNNSNAKVFQQGTVLVAMYGATVGRTGILGIDATTNQALCAILPLKNALISKFIFYRLQSQRQTLIDQSFGGAQPNINQGIIRAFPLPLPPLPEQQRIVAAIEQQFSRLDAGVAALRQAKEKLKRYRAAVLKAAVEGKLTASWRAEHPATEPASKLLERILDERRAKWEADLRAKGRDPTKVRYVEPKGPEVESLPELPEGWCWATVEQIGDVQLGRQRAPQHHTGDYMRPYLRVANVFEDRIEASNVMTMNFTPEEFEVYRLKFGDLLLNEGQSLELIGRPAMYRDEIPNACFQNTLVRFRAYPGLMSQYALSVFRVYMHTKRFQRIGRHTTNIAHLGAGRFAVLEFPLPPSTEQEQIVSEVEQRLSIVSELEATVEANLKRAERLRQSILKEAFAGRLVPQDPDDEPASVLLERIRQERNGRRNGKVNGERVRDVELEEPVKIDVKEVQQAGLWEGVGG